MKKHLRNAYIAFLIVAGMPVTLSEFFSRATGAEYGVSFPSKLLLVVRMIRNNFSIISGSNFLEHLAMATKILNIPASVNGCVVECGCYKGASSANLSLVCALTYRDLEVFDSFAGLPEPEGDDRAHVVLAAQEVPTYAMGSWSGEFEEVRNNIRRYGRLEVCNFHVGYFEDTLPGFSREVAMAFADVDLVDSLTTCLTYLWPVLQDGCCFFTHEAHHMEISNLFFNRDWWRDHLDADPPGLIGANTGLGLVPASGGYTSAIGYTVKNPTSLDFKESPQLGAKAASK